MLTEIRWQKERELMESVFPQFKSFGSVLSDSPPVASGLSAAESARNAVKRRSFGFEGRLRGKKSGRVYRVLMEAEPEQYPQCPPKVYIDPPVGQCWIGLSDRRNLCVTRAWRPARSTFANTLLVVVKYLYEHDGEPDYAPILFRGEPPAHT